jgi:hypothetical protein
MPSELIEEFYSSNLYFEDSNDCKNEYIDSESEYESPSNEHLDLISSNYQIPLVDQNRIHVLNYIDRLGFVLTDNGLYRKENYKSKYNIEDFMLEKNIQNNDNDAKNNIEKIKNFFRQKKIQKLKNKKSILKTVKNEKGENKEEKPKNVWFKDENVIKEQKPQQIQNKTNFDKDFPSFSKPEIKDENLINNDKVVEIKENIKKDEGDNSEDEEYDLSYLVQKNCKNIVDNKKFVKKPIEKPFEKVDNFINFKTEKTDKNNGWIKVESTKEVKNIKERNNAYDILSDKDKLKTKLKRTKLCLSVLNKNNCPHKENCRYAHKFEELEPCLFSDNCRFIKKEKGKYVNISKTKICEYKHKNETESNYFNRITVNSNNIHSPDKNTKNLNIKKL